jgi:hypothetical protein
MLQHPLIHAFKMDFNNWTVGTIKEQIKNGKYPNVDFKMSNSKPCICEWLHNTGKELNGKKIQILKGWEKIGSLELGTINFSLLPRR